MKIRGNESGAETSFLTSYFLPNKPSNNPIALNLNKISTNPIRFFINNTPSTIVVNFTTNN